MNGPLKQGKEWISIHVELNHHILINPKNSRPKKLTYDVDSDISFVDFFGPEFKDGQFSRIEMTHSFTFESAFVSHAPGNKEVYNRAYEV